MDYFKILKNLLSLDLYVQLFVAAALINYSGKRLSFSKKNINYFVSGSRCSCVGPSSSDSKLSIILSQIGSKVTVFREKLILVVLVVRIGQQLYTA